MPKCPNCGRTTGRTEDWACQWCGSPLLSRSYKKIPKTYKQLKEERLYKLELPAGEESVASPPPNHDTSPPAHMLETEPEPAPQPEPPMETQPEPTPQPGLLMEIRPEPIEQPEPAMDTAPEAIPQPEPIRTTIEVTVEELCSAHTVDSVAADAKYRNKILKLTGVVDRIVVKDIHDIYYIMLTSAEKKEESNVRCVFDKKHGPELSRVTTGQTVTVQGKYDGYAMNILVTDCVLVR